MELGDINIPPVHSQRGILGEMNFLEQVVVVFSDGCELHDRGYANKILRDSMHASCRLSSCLTSDGGQRL
ncbi:MAG: hypothetical protein L6U16_08275 [Porphyromonadaceae bacterium]|nr:MAG: hypothetical protein L6U16_08275 [Porphyromonadaceae bacterium]